MRSLIEEQVKDLVPHSGGMCLLDKIVAWDATTVCCISESHRLLGNPLRSRGRLAAVHALEYGAQAMAVHGGLLAHRRGETNAGGYLAALRHAVLHVARLDDLEDPLMVRAEMLAAEGNNLIYQFTVHSGERPVAEARATVIGRRRSGESTRGENT